MCIHYEKEWGCLDGFCTNKLIDVAVVEGLAADRGWSATSALSFSNMVALGVWADFEQFLAFPRAVHLVVYFRP